MSAFSKEQNSKEKINFERMLIDQTTYLVTEGSILNVFNGN